MIYLFFLLGQNQWSVYLAMTKQTTLIRDPKKGTGTVNQVDRTKQHSLITLKIEKTTQDSLVIWYIQKKRDKPRLYQSSHASSI